MKKELNYFYIDGSYGGSQGWFTNIVMRIGGCAAATACDSSIYFAREKNLKILCPFEAQISESLTKENYIAFSQMMKPYIKPRMSGVKKLSWYIEGYQSYIREAQKTKKRNEITDIDIKEFTGGHSFLEAKEVVKLQIQKGIPIPFLLLKHQNNRFSDFVWHWFLLTEFEECGEEFYVTAATYGQAHKLPFRELWDTGFPEKGGMILYDIK